MRTLVTLVSIAAMLISSVNAKEPKPIILYRIGDVPVEMRDGDKLE